MNTRELLNKMPKEVIYKLEELKAQRRRYEVGDPYREVIRVAASNYCQGLKDAGLITERGRQTLFIYTTV